MIMDIDLMFKAFLLSWVITNFTPIQDGLNYIKPKLPSFFIYIMTAFGCWKCMGLWITWFLTGDIFSALTVSLVANIVDRLLAALPMKL